MPAANEPPGRVNPSGILDTGVFPNDVANGDASPWTVLNDGVNIPGLPVDGKREREGLRKSKKKKLNVYYTALRFYNMRNEFNSK